MFVSECTNTILVHTGALETFVKAYKLLGECGGMTYPNQFHKKLFIQPITTNVVNNMSYGLFQLTLSFYIFL
jgi:hypothetical protein